MSVLPVISEAKHKSSVEVTHRLPEILEQYLRWHRVEGHTEATIRHYRAELRLFLVWLGTEGHSLLAGELTSQDILGHLHDMRVREKAPKSVDTRLRDIRAWVHWMIDWEVIPGTRIGKGQYLGDPCARIPSPKVPKIRKPIIKQVDFQKLLDICPLNTLLGSRRQAMLWMMITSGIRRREMSMLTLADLDWERENIRVIFGKGQKERHIPFSKDCQKAMLRYLHQRRDSHPCLWITEEGQPLKYYGIGQDLSRLADRAGVEVKDICHIYRRSFAVASVRQGVPNEEIKSVTGWGSNQMIEHYTASLNQSEAALQTYRRIKPFA